MGKADLLSRLRRLDEVRILLHFSDGQSLPNFASFEGALESAKKMLQKPIIVALDSENCLHIARTQDNLSLTYLLVPQGDNVQIQRVSYDAERNYTYFNMWDERAGDCFNYVIHHTVPSYPLGVKALKRGTVFNLNEI